MKKNFNLLTFDLWPRAYQTFLLSHFSIMDWFQSPNSLNYETYLLPFAIFSNPFWCKFFASKTFSHWFIWKQYYNTQKWEKLSIPSVLISLEKDSPTSLYEHNNWYLKPVFFKLLETALNAFRIFDISLWNHSIAWH